MSYRLTASYPLLFTRYGMETTNCMVYFTAKRQDYTWYIYYVLYLLFRTFVYRIIIDNIFSRKVIGLWKTVAVLVYISMQLTIRPCTYSCF